MLKGAVVRTIEQENVPQKTSEQDEPAQGFREEERSEPAQRFREEERSEPAQGFREEGGEECAKDR